MGEVAALNICWWDLRERERAAREVSVTFYRPAGERRAGVRLSTSSYDANDIAQAIEYAFDLEPERGGPSDVHALLICNGTSFPIGSARLSNIGAALLRWAGQVF